ncbi:GNAT family N-acetyltransferase [Phyllobacterium chamaecytisi]|uniref:GNAT family N-acetyltransferase n=1 Tax=Phyllobacterium chamaecytisi TaxID=2876082 RepID=UPI00351DA01E
MTIALLEPASITKDQRVMSHVDSTSSPFTAPHLASVLGRIGTMEVCLAQTEDEIASSQQLRFKVFFDELGAKGSATMEQRDADRFDPFCDHLLVYDTSIAGPKHKQIVGTYRLLRSEKAFETGGFYSASEFSIERLVTAKPELRFLELGRSCVLPEYRSKRTVELLWQGIWTYCRYHSIGVMFGCASFQGTVPAAHALPLSFLQHNCRATPDWDVRALPALYHAMDLVPNEAINPKVALFAMPPLIKGYLRLGAMIGDGAVVDHDFGTTDVFIILPVSRISERYVSHYAAEAKRFV